MYNNQQPNYQQQQQYQQPQQGHQGGGVKKQQRSEFVQACYQHKFAIKGRLARAHVLSTFDFQNKGNPKHSTYLIVDPNDPKVIQLQNVVAQLKQQFFPHVPDLLWTNPLKDGRMPTKPNGDQWQDWQKGKVFFGCSTKPASPPGAHVMDPNSPNGKGYREATFMDEKTFFYDGAEAIVEVALGGMEGDKKGVNLYFNGILGYGTGERIVISSSGSFNVEEAFKDFLGDTAGGNYNQQPQYQNTQPAQQPQYQQQNNGQYQQQNNGYAPQQNHNGQQYQNNGQYQQQNLGGQTQHHNNGQQAWQNNQPTQQNNGQYQQQNNGYAPNNGQNNNGGGSLV